MSIPRSNMSDGRSPRVPYRTEEIAQDLTVHRKAVAGVMAALVARLRQRATTHDRTMSDMFKPYADAVNRRHAAKEAAWAFVPEEHMKAETHHWDVVMPRDPDIVDLLEYMVDRTVRSLQHEGLAPEPLKVPQSVIERVLAKTADEITELAEKQEVQDA